VHIVKEIKGVRTRSVFGAIACPETPMCPGCPSDPIRTSPGNVANKDWPCYQKFLAALTLDHGTILVVSERLILHPLYVSVFLPDHWSQAPGRVIEMSS